MHNLIKYQFAIEFCYIKHFIKIITLTLFNIVSYLANTLNKLIIF